jgi:hypothetical protein
MDLNQLNIVKPKSFQSNSYSYQVLISHFAWVKTGERDAWLKRRSIDELELLLDGFRKDYASEWEWDGRIEELIKEKKAQLRDDKLKELGID